VEQGQQHHPYVHSEACKTQAEWVVRQRARERRKLIGVVVIVVFILALAFFRFGRTIPWGAR